MRSFIMMSRGTCVFQILLLSILISTLAPSGVCWKSNSAVSHEMFSNDIEKSSRYRNHSKIVISQNEDLENSWTGSGTETDPYLIEGLHIRDVNVCISITDTTVYLLIQNCLLECIEDSGSKCLELFGVNNIRVERCLMRGAYRGVSVRQSQGCILTNNSVYDCVWGIYIISTSNSTLDDNRIFRNDRGAAYFNSGFWLIKNNRIYRNYYKGLIIGSRTENCTIFGNFIGWNRDSASNAEDNAGVSWDDNESSGNFWSDYDGNGHYSLGGTANSVDRYPNQLIDNQPPIVKAPPEIYYEEGTKGNRLEWNASDTFPCKYEIFLNGYLIHSNTWDGSSIKLNIDGLNYGIHNYTVIVTDVAQYSMNSVVVDVFVNVLGDLGSEILALSSLFSVLSVLIVLVVLKNKF